MHLTLQPKIEISVNFLFNTAAGEGKKLIKVNQVNKN